MKEHMVQTRSLNMNVLEEGHGPVVLLCHGFPETAYAWRHQIHGLAAVGFRAIAPDMRGYGHTDAPEAIEAYTVFHLVGDMVAMLDALGEETAVIVGNDWGATVAWQAALMRPDRLRGVVALGVPMMAPAPSPPTTLFPQTPDSLFYTLYFQQPGVAEAEFENDVATTLRKILYAASGAAGAHAAGDGSPNPFGLVSRREGLLASLPAVPALPAWLTEGDLSRFVEDFKVSGFHGGLNYYRNLDRNWELQAALDGRKVEVPAQYLFGEFDGGMQIPGMAEIIAAMPKLVPKLEGSLAIKGAGHWLPQEKPQQVTDAISTFAQRLR